MPAFGNALSQPVPQQTSQVAPIVNTKENTQGSAAAASTTSGTTTDSTGNGGGGVFDGIISMINSMNTGVSSVNSNGATLLKSIASSLTQLQQFMKMFKTCGSSSSTTTSTTTSM